MLRTAITITITVIVMFFAMQNFDHVPIYLFFGKPVLIRLFFVVAIAGVLGYLIRSIIGIGREERLKRKLQVMLHNQNKRRKQDAELDE
jgi:uncharacterized integral membrane protein